MYLNCHSYYSLRFGTFSETDLLELARNNHVMQLALTDVNNTSACLNFIRKAPEYGIKPVVGIDFRNGAIQQFVGIAKNNAGYAELNRYLSEHLHRGIPFPGRAPKFENAFVVYPFEKVLELDIKDLLEYEKIGISIKDLRKLRFSKYRDQTQKLVVNQPVTFRDKKDFNTHRLLRAIANNTLLSMLSKEEEADEDEKMYPIANLCEAFRDFPQLLENTDALLKSCSIEFDFSAQKQSLNQQVFHESPESDEQRLLELCMQNLKRRYPENQDAAFQRMQLELGVIKKMNFVSYFLINHRIVEYARSRNYFYVGRGSGANSIVAYLIGITDVDPIELDLYFERFINLFRSSPPDFDIDFSWRDRQDVTDFIFREFANVALMGTYVTFNYKGVVRELGKVFGLPKEEIDRLSEGNFDPKTLDQTAKLVLKYGEYLHGMPNYLSVHSSGIIISEKPLTEYAATFLPPKGFPVVQFDMHIAEDVGLYKFDILAQRGLAKIKEALEIIAINRPEITNIDIHDLPRFKVDPNINALLSKGQCMGCFYIESPAMRMLLSKLEVRTYIGLVAASSIIRPGVSKSGMMREYILRHRNPERIQDAHPVMLEIMPETYGVMVYQEDVIKVAHYFAGLSLAEADVLRRGMSGKYRSREEFQSVEQKFLSNCRQKGYEEKVIQEVWKQIESFAGYAFAKGHSASYAVESYQSLFLCAYFPLEYMVAVLNNGGGFYRPEIYVQEAERLGATIHAPCINQSHHECVLRGSQLFLGLGYLHELEERVAHRIIHERTLHGPFASLEDFINRINLGIEQLSILIRINAFRFTETDKYELLWQAHFKLGNIRKFEDQYALFVPKHREFSIPVLNTTAIEAAFDQLELLGFCLCSPFNLLLEEAQSTKGAQDLKHFINRPIDIYGYLVTVKRTRTSNGREMQFATFIDQSGAVFDAVLFPPTAEKFSFRGKGIYRLYGRVAEELGFLSIEVIKMRKESYIEDPRYSDKV